LRFDDTVRPGELELTGVQTVSRYLYAELFSHLGTNVGEGDAADTFHLPNVDGQFLRGTDNGTGLDPNAATRTAMNTNGNTGDAVGAIQLDGFKAHNHNSTTFSQAGLNGSVVYTSNNTLAQPTSTTGGSETRPVNAYVNIFMKVAR